VPTKLTVIRRRHIPGGNNLNTIK